MAQSGTRDRHLQTLLEHVERDPYPSNFHMDLLESALSPEEFDPYIEILLDKVAAERYPSNQMLLRIDRLVALRAAFSG